MFWQGQYVVVTGGAGMLGSYLVPKLLELGARVRAIDDYSRGHNQYAGVAHIGWDASNYGLMCDAICGSDVVFNLAASVGGIYFNQANQAEQFWQNVQLQTIPAMAAAKGTIPIFVQMSSVCVYAAEYNSPAREENGHQGEPEGANAGYAWAKRMGEKVCTWALGDKTRWMIARPSNMYGERDYFDSRAHVIPALIRKFIEQNRVIVYGGPQTREFLHAEDCADALLCIAEHGETGTVYNVGTNGETCVSIAELAMLIKKLTGSKATVEFDDSQPMGDKQRWTDASRLNALGWNYKIGLEEGLRRTIEWYKSEELR